MTDNHHVSDIVVRLRKAATQRARGGRAWADYADAADEIERLRARVKHLEFCIGTGTPDYFGFYAGGE